MNSQPEERRPGEWAEPLPKNCPPPEAYKPHFALFYRFVATSPPSANDFLSYCALHPQKEFRDKECQARALSLVDDKAEAFNRVRKLPVLKGKKVASIVLPPESGLILMTGKPHRHHFSWWLRAGFDPVPICCIVSSESDGDGGGE